MQPGWSRGKYMYCVYLQLGPAGVPVLLFVFMHVTSLAPLASWNSCLPSQHVLNTRKEDHVCCELQVNVSQPLSLIHVRRVSHLLDASAVSDTLACTHSSQLASYYSQAKLYGQFYIIIDMENERGGGAISSSIAILVLWHLAALAGQVWTFCGAAEDWNCHVWQDLRKGC